MNAHHKKRSYRPPPPKSTARFTSGSDAPLTPADEAKSKEGKERSKLRRTAERVPFGWQLDALVPAVGPSTSTLAANELEKLLKAQGGFYVCEGVNLADLLEVEFLNSFVRKGSLVALSLDDDEGADIVAIDGRGRLILSVSKDTYELLGFPGRASAFGSFRQRFIIEISLIDPALRAGKPGFERVKRLLRDWPRQTDLFDALAGIGANGEAGEQKGKTFDLVMCYADEDGAAQPITFPSAISAELHDLTFARRTLTSVHLPAASSFPPASSSSRKKQRTSSGAFRSPVDDRALFWDEYREWAGLAMLGEQGKIGWREGGAQEEEEEWGVPLEEAEKGEVTMLSWSGLMHPKVLGQMLDSAAKNPIVSSCPFFSLTFRPFSHAPISHLSTANPPVVGTSKKPNGKKRKRGRGKGEEEEADRGRMDEAGGWEVVLKPAVGGRIDWFLWEGQ